ncbi:MAG: hypothetical protein HCAMLNBO_00228 [Candidatus Brocadia fulgida]|nr:hypothetical protein [Candidatus Brocadia fulgida]
MFLLIGNNHVYVVGAAQAVIGDGQERIGVGRQIDTRDRWALVGNQINESGVLMRKSVVILTPDRG